MLLMFWKLKIENLKIQDEIEKLNSENVIKMWSFHLNVLPPPLPVPPLV